MIDSRMFDNCTNPLKSHAWRCLITTVHRPPSTVDGEPLGGPRQPCGLWTARTYLAPSTCLCLFVLMPLCSLASEFCVFPHNRSPCSSLSSIAHCVVHGCSSPSTWHRRVVGKHVASRPCRPRRPPRHITRCMRRGPHTARSDESCHSTFDVGYLTPIVRNTIANGHAVTCCITSGIDPIDGARCHEDSSTREIERWTDTLPSLD